MTRSLSTIVLSCMLLASVAFSDGALANDAKTAAKPVKLDATGELLVKIVGTPAPSGLDAAAHASLKSIVAKLKSGDVDGALAAYKTFLHANAKKLGKSGVAQTGDWLVRVALVEPVDDLAGPADKVRFARDAKVKAASGLAGLQAAKENAAKSGKSVSVKLVTVAKYQKFQPATKEVTANLSAAQIQSSIDQVKTDLDSMSEMGEMESLRLQMAMDRMSKMMSTLSNILKKISETSQSITQNLK